MTVYIYEKKTDELIEEITNVKEYTDNRVVSVNNTVTRTRYLNENEYITDTPIEKMEVLENE